MIYPRLIKLAKSQNCHG